MESFIERKPKLAVEWYTELNRGINPKYVSCQSQREVWWKCKRGHKYKAIVRARVNIGLGCPECR